MGSGGVVKKKNKFSHSLLTVRSHDIRDANSRRGDIENPDHLLVNGAHLVHLSAHQVADGSHGNGPVELSAAHQHAAAGQDFLFGQRHVDEALVLIGLFEMAHRETLEAGVDPQGLTDGLHALQTCTEAFWRRK